ncbi:hypothetical protein WB904_001890 [Vibrio parahaemolyticus]
MAGDNNYSLGPVPNTARKGVASLTMVMLGLTFFSASDDGRPKIKNRKTKNKNNMRIFK